MVTARNGGKVKLSSGVLDTGCGRVHKLGWVREVADDLWFKLLNLFWATP